MSVMVLLIAFVPAIAVVVATEFTHNRVVIVGIAMVAAAIGVLTGSPIYMLLDLLFVGGALYIAWQLTAKSDYELKLEREAREAQERERQAKIAAERAQAAKTKSGGGASTLLGLVVIAGWIFSIWKPWSPEPPKPPKPSAQPAVVTSAPAVATQAPPKVAPVKQKPQAQPTKPASQRPPSKQKPEVPRQTQPPKQMVDCLLMQSDKEMVRCLESAQ